MFLLLSSCLLVVATGWRMDQTLPSRLFVQGAVSPVDEIRAGWSLVLVWHGGIPASFFSLLANSSSSLTCDIIGAWVVFLPHFMCSFIFVSPSPAFPLVQYLRWANFLSPGNDSGPGVIITGYYSHSFHLGFYAGQTWSHCCRVCFSDEENPMLLAETHVIDHPSAAEIARFSQFASRFPAEFQLFLSSPLGFSLNLQTQWK